MRAALGASARTGAPFLLVGGAVRDALLGLPPGDVDLAVARERAPGFVAALAAIAGSRPVTIGRPPRRILHVPFGRTSIDVWETDGDPAGDLLRRDFTVNAIGVSFPGGRLVAPDGALADLAARRLRLPRRGVLVEDPLRVVRAARFLARLPGFRLDPRALPELREAARSLSGVAPERLLAELDAILAAGPSRAALALARLESWGALAAILGGLDAPTRRRGVAAVRRGAADSPPALLRTLLVSPADGAAADRALERLRTSRSDRRLAATLLALPRPPARPTREGAVRLLRRAAPFSREAVAFWEAVHGRRGRALARLAESLLAGPGAIGRLLKPRRPLSANEVAALLGVSGPELGRALERLDEALATGAVRGGPEARAFLRGPAARGSRRASIGRLPV